MNCQMINRCKKNQQVKKPKSKGKNASARVTYPMVIP